MSQMATPQEPSPPYPMPMPVIVPQQLPTVPQPMGPSSTHTTCPICHSAVYTNTSRKAKSNAWWSCILLCICGCFCGCCLIPCCLDSCNVINHTCPKCNAYLGQYRA